MKRVFVKDKGRFKKGDIRDYPLSTWNDFFPGYTKFTRPCDDEYLSNSMKDNSSNEKT